MRGGASAAREPVIDALRVVALAAVFAVNLSAYATAIELGPLAPPAPADSTAAWSASFLIGTLLQGKGYPLLSFLFGYSFALSLRRRSVEEGMAHRKRRMRRLLLLGVLHGVFVYWGDVLTLYALSGLLLLRWAPWRLTRLLRRLKWLAGIGAVLMLATAALVAWAPPATGAVPGFGDPMTPLQWLSLNGRSYVKASFGSLLLLPEVLALMLAGFIGGRLRLFSHRRWRVGLQRCVAWALPWGLLTNACLTVIALHFMKSMPASGLAWAFLSSLLGPLLLLGAVPWCVLRWQSQRAPLLRWLVPAGASTLTLYLCSSLLGLLVWSGLGAGFAPGTLVSLLAALAAWGVLVLLLRSAALKGAAMPLERWLARP